MRRLAGIIVVVSLLFAPTAAAQESLLQPDFLPADLLFGVVTDEPLVGQLMRLDAQTLAATVFYEDDARYIRPLSWSPSGRLLAILKYPQDTLTYGSKLDLCILDRDGALQACFVSAFTREVIDRNGEFYRLTWSEDEKSVYFMQEEGDTVRVVEADIASGEIGRTIYEYSRGYGEYDVALYWDPQLRYVEVFTDAYNSMSGAYHTVTITDLATGETYPLTDTSTATFGEAQFCPGFSPQGSYLLARTHFSHDAPLDAVPRVDLSGFVITDATGHPVQTLDRERLTALSIHYAYSCPVWQADEKAFYFIGGSRDAEQDYSKTLSVFRYELATDKLTEVHRLKTFESRDASYTYNPEGLAVSPDGSYFAFHFYIQAGGYGPSRIEILYPDGTIFTLQGAFTSAYSPMWFPAS